MDVSQTSINSSPNVTGAITSSVTSNTSTLNPIITTVTTTTTNLSTTITPKKSLGLLAEVALKQHQYEELHKQNTSNESNNNTNKDINQELSPLISSKIDTRTINRSSISLKQLKRFSDKKLLSTFTEYKRDIKTKRCTYRCQMLPNECQMKFESFGSDIEQSKQNILSHIQEHVRNLEITNPSIKLNSCRKVRKTIGTKKDKLKAKTSSTDVIKTESNVDTETKKKKKNVPQKQTNTVSLTDHNYPTSTISTRIVEKPETITGNINNQIIENKNYITLTNSVSAFNQPLQNVIQARATEVIRSVEDVPQTLEIISSGDALLPASTIITQPAVAVAPAPAPPPVSDPEAQIKMRELALDYIDDIRKKSSSAAKSIIVNGDKSVIYQCKICPDKQFTSTNGLIFHYKKHAGLKPYVCEICSATFTRQHSLNYHMLIHYNKSRFVCSECSRHFRHPSHFKEHMRRHTGETPFQCSDCFIRFKTRNTYKRHLQTKHSKILTSKGIIELPNAAITTTTYHHQNVPKNYTDTAAGATTVVLASKSGSSTGIVGGTIVPVISTTTSAYHQQPSTSGTIVKPRRKYGLRYLHKNIETINKYEQQQFQQQHSAALITHGNTATPIVHHSSDPLVTAGGAIAATAQTAPGSNITILSIPHYPTVRILDSSIGTNTTTVPGGSPIARKTSTLMNYNRSQPQHPGSAVSGGQPTSITLLPVSSYHDGKTVLTPIQLTTTNYLHHAVPPTSTDEIIIRTGKNLTELMPLATTQTVYHLHQPISSANQTTIFNQQPTSNISQTNSGINTTQQLPPPMPPQPNNDNFMRLLEAIELKEEEV